MAILKHIASKNADYGKSLEYLMFEHTENGTPVRDAEGNMIMRERFLLDGINCTPFSYDKECEMLNAQFHKNQKYSDIKSHHYIISFDPQDSVDGKITAEQAHALGLTFAKKHFPGHQILICTHTDGHNESGNIHVHIIFNSVRKLDVEKQTYMDRDIDSRAGYKHHLTKGYLEYLQAEVMEMSEREGLRQVDLLSPAKSKISDKEYRLKQRGQKKLDELNAEIIAAQMKPTTTVFQTQKQFLRDAISDVAAQAGTMEEFQKLLKEKYGIAVKDHRGRFSYLHPERSKYITGRALGSDFEKEALEQMIADHTKGHGREEPIKPDIPVAAHTVTAETADSPHSAAAEISHPANPHRSEHSYDRTYDYHADPIAILYVRSHLRLVVDLQTNIKAQQNAAYARKVKLSNLKEMAKTVVYVQEHGYDTQDDLQMRSKNISEKLLSAEGTLQEVQQKLQKTNEQIHFTGQYYATRAIRTEFLKAGNKKQFRAAHRNDLDLYDEAVRYFKDNTGGTIPSMNSLRSEKENLLQMISEQKQALSTLRAEQKELQTVVANIDAILSETPAQKKEKRRSDPEL